MVCTHVSESEHAGQSIYISSGLRTQRSPQEEHENITGERDELP